MSTFDQCSSPLALTGQAFDALKSSPSDVFTMASVWSQPMVMRQLVADWPAVKVAQQGSRAFVDYLLAFDNHRTVDALELSHEENGRVFYNSDMTGFNFSRQRLPFQDALSKLLDLEAQSDPQSFYVGSTSVDACLPGFLSENTLGQTTANPLATLWIGNKSRIAAHYDVPDNVICVVSGKRKVTLFPPEQAKNLYVGPLHVTPAGQAISLVDFHNPNFSQFPKFKEAIKHALVVELMPGDVLYIPSMWWHHIEGLDSVNTLVNFWWRDVPAHVGRPDNALFHALLTIKQLPASQRAAWRHLFDHYVFDENHSKNFEHIPSDKQGPLGTLDENAFRQFSAWLQNSLKQ
ncbi:cupin-like domain-containing protein [Alteromonas sp. KUL49]|uniref:cupin-like domain-containing protein n=1 Tax=Alteromonas sp. KUL49 TaxID=2480798 RepID=UPI0010FFBA03|nr:cupin-like domain-containing protein [Alteromonas sp. KUL49]GEA10014.1 cupin [Alteromonas sp. KUL49]